jgi:hypothetical protein
VFIFEWQIISEDGTDLLAGVAGVSICSTLLAS